MHIHAAMAGQEDQDDLIAASRHAVAGSRVCIQRAKAQTEVAAHRIERARNLLQSLWLQRELLRRRRAARLPRPFLMYCRVLRTAPPRTTLNAPRGEGAVAAPKSLAEMVRDKLDVGTLPVDDPVKMWSGRGTGLPCTACEQAILRVQIEYEPQYDDGRPLIRLHIGCHGLWEAERQRRGYLPPK